jgi:hypothetical protein
MIYTGTICKTKEDIEHINKCLDSIKNGYVCDFIQVGSYRFSNGITIYIDLCSGDSNYYLQYVLVDKNNNEVDSDTIDSLEDFEIKDNKNIYRVHFALYEEC